MTSAILSDGMPISEEDFLAMGETPDRIELFDGSLHMTPNPTTTHQHLLGELFAALRLPARDAGLRVLLAPNVRLQPNRIPIPDLVITSDMERKLAIEAETVLLTCEITSPSNAATDKVLKMHYYASAGIPWYLLVEQATAALRLYRLAGETYVEHAVVEQGAILRLREPVVATLDPAELAPPV
ncbi:Uma2 family endonuclease [Paractinoplanes toevensis]|nr:Uma2 family endonuclease [Actinoplanes toevensis]